MVMGYEEILVFRKRRWDFHIYHDKINTNVFRYKIDDDAEFGANEMEYLDTYKIMRIKNRYKRLNGMTYKGVNIKFKGKRVFGFMIDNNIIHKILVHAIAGDDIDNLYTYENYLKHNEMIKGKKGYVVRKCKLCDDAILLSSVTGKRVGSFRVFMGVRNIMRELRKQAGKKDTLFCYAVGDKHYFIPSTSSRGFICRACLTGVLYRTGYYVQE